MNKTVNQLTENEQKDWKITGKIKFLEYDGNATKKMRSRKYSFENHFQW